MPESATVLLEEAPEFSFAGGLFYVSVPGLPTRAMRPNTFFRAIAGAVEQSRAYRLDGAEVLPFPVKDAAEH